MLDRFLRPFARETEESSVSEAFTHPPSREHERDAHRHRKAMPLPRNIALVLQGGGALGSYQCGVFEEMVRLEISPNWVAGISIGAINAALIAGNPPEKRMDALCAFWDKSTGGMPNWILPNDRYIREAAHLAAAATVATFGVPGFFMPHYSNPYWGKPGRPESISFYDPAPLETTLNDLVDWDLLNDGSTRVSVGAVNVETGNFRFFDNQLPNKPDRIDARHIMASAALPPAFPPVEIDGKHYWDGGLVSNTPLGHLLDNQPADEMLVFQVDLFPATGPIPQQISEVLSRKKDIRFSSRTRQVTDNYLRLRREHELMRKLLAKLPPEMDEDEDVHELARLTRERAVNIVHLIYRARVWESNARDFEFSRSTMLDHWHEGQESVLKCIRRGDILARNLANGKTAAFDLAES